MWGDYRKTLAVDDEAMSKAVADGTRVGLGDYSILNHQEGLAAHGSWFSASSTAKLIKALEQGRS